MADLFEQITQTTESRKLEEGFMMLDDNVLEVDEGIDLPAEALDNEELEYDHYTVKHL